MQSLEELNAATKTDALAALLACCGSTRWAREMVDKRPFEDLHELYVTAEHVWWSLDEVDWLEAFRAHPKIGEKRSSETSIADRWASDEQSGAGRAQRETLDALRKANQDYEKRFGYIFIVCATGKNAEQMLALINERMTNEPDAEIRIAAEEQARITQIRLNKLLGKSE